MDGTLEWKTELGTPTLGDPHVSSLAAEVDVKVAHNGFHD